MQKSLTWILVGAAVLLFAFTFYVDRRIPGSRERAEPPLLFAELEPGEASAVQFSFPGGAQMRAERSNEGWVLRGLNYPAQQAAVENFLTNAATLRALDRLAPHEVALQGAGHFGLEPPRASVQIEAGTNTIRFEIGGQAPLAKNIYLRLQPSGEVVLAGAQAAELAPAGPEAWRDPRVVNLASLNFDALRIRAGARSFELGRGAAGRDGAWRLLRPVPARADQQRVAGLLETLRGARVRQFVADSAADLERYGLQTPDLELNFLQGTNLLFTVQFGAAPTNQPSLVFARLAGRGNIVTVPRELADALRQPYKNFHEPQLVSFRPEALDRILVDAQEKFALERAPGGGWAAVLGSERMAVDGALLSRFLTNVLAVEILDIAKEVPTEADLKAFGLLAPSASFAFFERFTNNAGILTNILFTELSFGTNLADRIYARRSDEVPVYFSPLAQMLALPRRAFELRDRQLWALGETNISRVSFSNAAGVVSLQRSPSGAWSDDPIADEAIREAVFRLASLQAVEWTARGEARKASFGFGPQPLTLLVEARGPEGPVQKAVQFGNATIKRNVYAAATLPGEAEPVLFEFPGVLFHSLLQLLPVPK